MTQSARAQEPSMEEILASIRRIIADDDPKAAPPVPPKAAAPPPQQPPPAAPPPPSNAMGQDDIDALMASFDEAPAPPPPAPPAVADILDLTEAVPVPRTAAKMNGFTRIDPGADVEFRDADAAVPAPTAVERAAPPPPAPAQQMVALATQRLEEPAGDMLSREASAAVSAAFGSLANTILSQNARTLEDLVKEMLRPMLKQWLDDHLPTIVERLVRIEIERVSRGR